MTFSVVAKDEKTGEFGVAVQSHWFSVGSVVSWAKAGVGAVATQSMVEISYGPLGLELMSSGKTASEALEGLLKSDSKSETRQVAFVDPKGRVAVHTGKKCIPYAGHIKGDGFSCQANLMRNGKIWGAIANAYRQNSKLNLAERLIATLEAGEEAGGDIHGKQSAVILVVGRDLSPNSWSGRLVDLRVEDHPTPIPELKRLLRLQRGYEWANKGDEFLNAKKYGESLNAYAKAGEFAPEIEELQFWQAVSLVQSGKLKAAKPIFQKVFAKNADWRQVTKSLSQVGLLKGGPQVIRTILSD